MLTESRADAGRRLQDQIGGAVRAGLRDHAGASRSVNTRTETEANAVTASFVSDSTIDAYQRGLRDSKAPLVELEHAYARGMESGRHDAMNGPHFVEHVQREINAALEARKHAVTPAVLDGGKLAKALVTELERCPRLSSGQVTKIGEAIERRVEALLGGIGVEVTHPE